MLMNPDFESRWILLMHHSDTLETPSLDLQGGARLLHAVNEPLAIVGIAGCLEVIDMRAQDEHESFGRFSCGLDTLSGASE